MTIADQLTLLASTKENIKTAIETKGVTVGAVPFAEYPAKIGEITGGGAPEYNPDDYIIPWERPAEWLELPTWDDTQQTKFVGLLAVYDTLDNRLAFKWHIANSVGGAGTRTININWGDGTTETVSASTATGTLYQHAYDYASIPGPVHPDGYKQLIVEIDLLDLPAGLDWYPGTYDGSPHTFLDVKAGGNNLGGLRMGASATLSLNATLQQVTITRAFMNELATTYLLMSSYSFANLANLRKIVFPNSDFKINADHAFTNCYSLQEIPPCTFGGNTIANFAQNCSRLIKAPDIVHPTAVSGIFIFSGCNDLVKAPDVDVPMLASAASMFKDCNNLQIFGQLNLPRVTSINEMFNECNSIREFPAALSNIGELGTGITTMASAFRYCSSVREIPDLPHTNITISATAAFQLCSSLLTAPWINFSIAPSANITANQLFQQCSSLSNVPHYDFSRISNASNMFIFCASLSNVPVFHMSNCIGTLGNSINGLSGMFRACSSLTHVELTGTENALTYHSMFLDCKSLVRTPAIDLGSTNYTIASMYNGCAGLIEAELDLSGATIAGHLANIFLNCRGLRRARLTGARFTFTLANLSLSADALVEVFEGLATVTGQTVTISGNWGAALLTQAQRDIALNKGWSITG